MILGNQAWAECDKICNENWWKIATTSDVKAELDAGADVMARNEYGDTPLHSAAENGTPESIQVLLKAGAGAKAKSQSGTNPWELAQDNDKLKGTKGYWALNDARYN